MSVLFADLVGFTSLAEGRDPEETRELLSRYFDLASDVIDRYGGTVEKFIGDAVMAVWGAPVAHEDDAERAVRAGLELVGAVTALGPEITARAGVLTGEAAVTVGATNQGLVAGDLVNTASRLQGVATPGTVLVGEATQRAASRAIAFAPAGEQDLKGKAAPVPAWVALRVVAEVGGRNRSESLEAPFVGRQDELRLLKDLYHATSREQRTRLVSVIGPAGIGKTRLAWEFLKYIDGLVEPVWWHDGRSPAYGDGISFWALGEMVRERAGLRETDDAATTRARIAETVAEHVPDPDERRWIEPALLALLGVESGLGADQLFGAWRTFFERMASTAPVVMVFEDHHFADTGLLDFVDHLLDWSRNVPIYVLTLSRPELLERRPEFGVGKRNFASLHLEPLSAEQMAGLLAGLVPGLPPEAVAAIVARADGMPLYAVETVRMLLAEGRLAQEGDTYRPVGDLTELAVPETLTALIASRLDALEPEDRSLVNDAAVLGQSFTVDALAAVTGIDAATLEPRLRALVRRELLTLEADPRSPGRGQFVFVQALIREVAYNTLARRDRKSRHLAAARYFDSLGSDELAGALAGHYVSAYRNAAEGPEADTLAAQARVALRAAAERAIRLGSPAQAVTFLDQAREVARDEIEVAGLLELSARAAQDAALTELAEERVRAAVEARRALDDADAIARTTAMLGEFLITGLRPGAAIAILEPAVEELVGDAGTPTGPDAKGIGAGAVALLAQLARALFFNEAYERSIEIVDRALAAGERLDLVDVVSDALITRGGALSHLGRTYEGMGAMRAGAELADQHGLTRTAIRGRLNLGVFLHGSDPRAGLADTREALDTARRLGLASFVRTLVGNASSAALDVGEWDWAIRELEAAREDSPDELARNYASWGLFSFRAWRGEDVTAELDRLAAWAESFDETGAREAVHQIRAEAAFGAGDLARAHEEWMAYAPSNALNGPNACFYAGLAALLAQDPDRASAALEAHRRTGLRGPLATQDRRLLQTGIAILEGQLDQGIRNGLAAIDGYRQLDVDWRLALAGLMLAATAGPDDPRVQAAAGQARETFERLGARPFLERLDAAKASTRAATTGTSTDQAAPASAPHPATRIP
ncbi:MAG TPA: adenylate/guanylate cyclase domain-containing protein [Candidatus Limnocylindrales bacterium]|nr:adenylate/guanylate cyclase domain-containing protein [Candidatus Limnocylindrales bacterium]